MAQRPRVRGKRVVGEIAEAPPVAEEARRFEEVPRLAAATAGGNRLARRWAIADPYTQRCRFYKTVIPRSEATWESAFPFDKGCGAGVLRIATAGVRTGFAMTGGRGGVRLIYPANRPRPVILCPPGTPRRRRRRWRCGSSYRHSPAAPRPPRCRRRPRW